MSEIENLLTFMNSDRRKKILLADYFELQEQKEPGKIKDQLTYVVKSVVHLILKLLAFG
ncbi:hypothetical protein D922_02776 [Enterococcus faecalis 06-MB-DW-09]|nr:hypothetical protein D922_02776 [Enterococcus faecalis 06-MB-DW-09]